MIEGCKRIMKYRDLAKSCRTCKWNIPLTITKECIRCIHKSNWEVAR